MSIRPAQGQAFPRIIRPPFVKNGGVVLLEEIAGLNFATNIAGTDAGAGQVNVDASGGGGGGLVFPESAPVSPSAFDDEFTSAGLDVKWTTVATPGGGFTTTPDFQGTYLRLDSPGAASNNALIIRQALSGFAAGTAFSLTAKVGLTTPLSGTLFSDVAIGNNATFAAGSYLIAGLACAAGTPQIQVYDGALVASPARATGLCVLYVHIQRNTSNVVRVFVSYDGVAYHMVNSATRAWNADYLFVRLYGNASTLASSHFCDFVRVGDSRFYQQ